MSVTIKDVARETGLASGTISKYLNGGSVRPENRRCIEEAIERLGYRPNMLARGLRSSRNYRIAFLLANLEGAHSAKLVAALEEQVRKMGCLLTIYCHRESPKIARDYILIMIEQSIDGLVVIPVYGDNSYLEEVKKAGIPTVILEDTYGIRTIDVVQTDCASVSYQIVEELIQNGHQKIGIICGSRYSTTAKERLNGYLRVMEDYEIPLRKEYLIEGNYDYASGYEGIHTIWQLPDPPTAVFITNSHMSVGALTALNQMKIRVPDDLSLAAFDDMELCSIVRPGLTAVRQPLKEMMKAACDILEKRIHGDYSDFPARVRLKATIVNRDSIKDRYGRR